MSWSEFAAGTLQANPGDREGWEWYNAGQVPPLADRPLGGRVIHTSDENSTEEVSLCLNVFAPYWSD